ncbi:MAG: ATP-binding cassette domain-containing protein, partial [Chlorobi bacterium]|nr:ATP-binding cassette domain-containing protein [Chlorobiota bacterium]
MTAETQEFTDIKPIIDIPDEPPEIEVDNINAYYGNKHVLKNISMKILPRRVTALIGPSGCGKSTFLRVLNRMNDYIEGFRLEGKVYFKGIDIYSDEIPIEELRSRIGMVFQKPNPFPQSIYDNVAFGLRIRGIKKKSILDETVEWALQQAALWDEVKDRLK